MARIRTIKPEFWSHPVLSRLCDSDRLMALALLNLADDEGYFLADPILIRNFARPFDDSSVITTGALRELSGIGWVATTVHTTHGLIGKIVNFNKHQAINKPRPSKLKGYFESGSTTVALPEDYRKTTTGNGTGNGMEQGMEGAVQSSHPQEQEPAVPATVAPKEKLPNADTVEGIPIPKNAEDLITEIQRTWMYQAKAKGSRLAPNNSFNAKHEDIIRTAYCSNPEYAREVLKAISYCGSPKEPWGEFVPGVHLVIKPEKAMEYSILYDRMQPTPIAPISEEKRARLLAVKAENERQIAEAEANNKRGKQPERLA